ncbi:thermostable hemolysin [Microbulbifer sp. ALW1]|uniref:thermostable hemolysin n=1 Tax=Microbulbifer sp. (strain ALW1) TaxID=1516059 RepID=UPI0013577727|nr:thermostable hemolysin [Microbulbifer sp. ALW1]
MAVDVRSQYAGQPRSLSAEQAGFIGSLGAGSAACEGDEYDATSAPTNTPISAPTSVPTSAPSQGHEASAPLSFRFSGDADPGRGAVEAYIAGQFHRVYGARLRHFMPWLLSFGRGNRMDGGLGLRPASSEPLFLEQYLDAPVEVLLGERAGVPVNRRDVAEIGNLVATARGGSRLLFLILAELFAAADLTWAIFTATPEVQHLLQKLTDHQLVLCRADGSRLGPELANWGSYYHTRPAVVAVNVRAERERQLERPLISELLQACRPQATAFAQRLVEASA